MALLGEIFNEAGVISDRELGKIKDEVRIEEKRKTEKIINSMKVTSYKVITMEMAKKWFGVFTTNVKKLGFTEAKILATVAVEDREMSHSAINQTATNYENKVSDLSRTEEGFRKILFWWEKEK